MVDGNWSDDASWDTAVAVVEGFMDYWERNRAVFRVVELTTVEGDLRFQGLRVRALNSVTVTLARVIANHAGTSGSPAGADPMAAAGTLVAMLAQVAGHRYGFEFWASAPRRWSTARHACCTGRSPAGPPPTGPSAGRREPGTAHRTGGRWWRRIGPYGQEQGRAGDLTAGSTRPPRSGPGGTVSGGRPGSRATRAPR